MYTCSKEKNGVVKTNWLEVEPMMKKISPEIAEMINGLSPPNKYPLYLVYLPYGMMKGDTESSFLPTQDNSICKLSDPNLPKELINDLGYGMYTSPFGMILENSLEYYIEHDNQIIPYDIATPGYIFHKTSLLNTKSSRNYSPNGILQASAGARTAFSLPSMNNFNNILKLNSGLDSKFIIPKKYADHGILFKQILSSNSVSSKWRTCLLYFSNDWMEKLRHDKAWTELKNHILNKDRLEGEFESKNVFYEIFYSYVQAKHNLKVTNPYLTQTIYHLFKIALGKMPGYSPAESSLHLPLNEIQDCLYNIYNIDNHPSIMVPNKFYFDDNNKPIYYSLQMPTMPNLSIKRNKRISANKEIEAINLMASDYIDEMKKKGSILNNTVFEEMAKQTSFSYYHNVPTDKNLVKHSKTLPSEDTRFLLNYIDLPNKPFCHEAQFLRGCIKISANQGDL